MGVTHAWTNLFFTPVITPILTFPLEGGRDLGLRKYPLRGGRGFREQLSMSERERIEWAERWAGGDYQGRSEPSLLVVAWADRLPKGRALDLACGNGRNALYLAERGYEVDALDIAEPALKLVRDAAGERGLSVNTILADLDDHPLPAETYDLITTSFYLNRSLIPVMRNALKPGGFVLHEQHYATDSDVSGPTDPDFRLASNELLRLFADFRVRRFSEGLAWESEREGGRLIALQQLVAQKPPATFEPPAIGEEARLG